MKHQITITILLLTFSLISFGANSERISEKKCNEYMEVYRQVTRSSYPPPFPQEIIGDLDCPDTGKPLITSGRDAEAFELPFIASMYVENKNGELDHICGGTLISEEFVLTAAHCLQRCNKGEIESIPVRAVLLGDIELTSEKSKSAGRKIVGIAETIIHKNYHPCKSQDDIALLKLSEPLKFERAQRPAIHPACLPTIGLSQNYLEQNINVTIAGWGSTGFSSRSEKLQVAELVQIDRPQCEESWKEEINYKRRFANGVDEKIICAGDRNNTGKDTCQGDSGGPLILKPDTDLLCKQYVIGVTSFGLKCGLNIPGIYTNVEAYLDWIEEHVWGSVP